METTISILFAIAGAVAALGGYVALRWVAAKVGDTAPAAGRDVTSESDLGPIMSTGDSNQVTIMRQRPDRETRTRLESVEEQLKEIQEQLAQPPQGTADIGTDELAKAAGPDTEAGLQEALELQAKNREREAIDALYEAFQKDLEPSAKAELHILLGNSFLRLSELEEAEGHYRQALDASVGANLRDSEANARNGLGLVYRLQGDLGRAEEHHRQSLEIAREIGNRLGEAAALGNLGLVNLERADLERAKDYFQQALTIEREFGNSLGEATHLGNLGTVYARLGDLKRAEEHCLQALTIEHEIGDRLGEASTLGNLGIVYRRGGDLARAEEHYKRALAIQREIGNRFGEASQLGNLGVLAAQRSRREEACRLLKEAAAIFEGVGAQSLAEQTRANLQKLGCE